MKKFLFLPVIFFMAATLGKDNKIEIKASVDKPQVKVGETFKYEIEIKGSFRISPEIIFSPMDNFQILSQQRVFNIRIGRKGLISDSKTIFILVPVKEGEFEIEGIKVRFNWREYEVPKVKIKVKGIKEKPETPAPEKSSPEVPSSGGGIWI